MINYLECAKQLYPTLTEQDISISEDENGVFISYWNEMLGVTPTLTDLEVANLGVHKDIKKADIKEEMYVEFETGKSGYTTQYLVNNIKIDSSRNDLDNFKNLMLYIQMNSLNAVNIKTFDNSFRIVTIAELQTIINELIGYGLWLYQHKWEKEIEIDSATTIEAVDAITFF